MMQQQQINALEFATTFLCAAFAVAKELQQLQVDIAKGRFLALRELNFHVECRARAQAKSYLKSNRS